MVLITNFNQNGRGFTWNINQKSIQRKIIKQILEDRKYSGKKITQQELVNAIGISKQGFTNKMTRDSFTDKDMYLIANYLGMEVIIKGEKEYILKED